MLDTLFFSDYSFVHLIIVENSLHVNHISYECFFSAHSTRYSSPGSNRPGSKGRQRTKSVPASSPPAKGRGALGQGRAPWRTSRPVPSKPVPSGKPLLLLQPLGMGEGLGGAARGVVLGYRIAPAGGVRESTQVPLNLEEEEADEEEELIWRSRNRLRALIRLEHNYSCPV